MNSPQQRYRISGELRIVAYERQVFVDRLGSQESIKRVFVAKGQAAEHFDMRQFSVK